MSSRGRTPEGKILNRSQSRRDLRGRKAQLDDGEDDIYDLFDNYYDTKPVTRAMTTRRPLARGLSQRSPRSRSREDDDDYSQRYSDEDDEFEMVTQKRTEILKVFYPIRATRT